MPFEQVSIREQPNHYVTEHFLYSDFICPCCDMLRLTPGFYRHAALLEHIRNELGFPIVVNSGYRCPSHNRKVGGAARSWHLIFATDVRPEDDAPASSRPFTSVRRRPDSGASGCTGRSSTWISGRTASLAGVIADGEGQDSDASGSDGPGGSGCP